MTRRRTLVAAIALTALIIGLLAVLVIRGKTPTSTSPQSTPARQMTVPETIMHRHADVDGQLDVEGALELFAYAVLPLPGVIVPAGAADDRARWADLALSTISTHTGELTSAQTDVVHPFFVRASSTRSASRRVPAAGMQIVTTKVNIPLVQADVEAVVHTAVTEEATKLGHSLSDAPVGAGNDPIHVILEFQDLPTSTFDAPAWTVCTHGPGFSATGEGLPTKNDPGKVTDCYIFLGPSAWDRINSEGHWNPGPAMVAVMYHEVFHCYQMMVVGSTAGSIAWAQPIWEKEGGANWAASAATGFDEPEWAGYLSTPTKPLNERAYDAVGVFFEMEYVGRPLWSNWWHIWSTAAQGGWSTTDWVEAIAGDHMDAFRDAWGSSFFQNTTLGHDWDINAPGQMITKLPSAPPVPFTGEANLFDGPYATVQVNIPDQPDGTIVVAAASNATLRVVDHAGEDHRGLAMVAMCWGNCSCPANSGGSQPDLVSVSGGVSLSATALQDLGNTLMHRTDNKEFCKKEKKDWAPPPTTPCSEGCAGSNGDPHMHTINGRGYSFQAAGEFTLLQAPNGVAIQGRQEPFDTSGHGITINTAIAARVGSHRVAVYATSAGPVVRIDGTITSVESPVSVGGGRVVSHSFGVEVNWPDGQTLWALSAGRFGINAQVVPSPALTQATGVLGVVTRGYVFPMLPDGTGLPAGGGAVARKAYLYQAFANAWRVTDQTSLFDYSPGKTTASYTVTGFSPEGNGSEPLELDPTTRARSEASCGPIVNVELHNDCVYDITVSGDAGFVGAYQTTETFLSTGTSGSESPPSPSASPLPRSTTAATKLIDNVTAVRGSVIGPDGALYVLVEETSRIELVAVDPTNLSIRARVTLSAPQVLDGLASVAGSLWLISEPDAFRCKVDRVDPATLQAQLSIAMPTCPSGVSPDIAGTGSTVWVFDPSLGSADGSAHVVQIDTTRNVFGVAVPVPSQVGALRASSTAVFWVASTGTYRVKPGSTTSVPVGTSNTTAFPSGDGVWVQPDPSRFAAQFFDGTGAPSSELPTHGDLVGADSTGVYVLESGGHGGNDLRHYPSGGGAAVTVLPGTTSSAAPLVDPSSRLLLRAFTDGSPPALFVERGELP